MRRRREVDVEVVHADDALAVPLPDQRAADADLAGLGRGAQGHEVHVVGAHRGLRLSDVDAALARDDRRVHVGHGFVNDAAQRALQGREREHPRVGLRDPPHVLERHTPDGALGQAGQDRAEALRQRQERADCLRHLRARRHVHRVRHELAAQREPHHLRDGRPRLVLRLHSGRAEMRRHHDFVEPEHVALRGGFLREHVERGAGHALVLEGLDQRVLVEDPAAGGVHDAHAVLHQGQLALPDEPLGLRGSRQVNRDEVALHEQGLERRHELHAHLPRPVSGHVRVERDHAHPERQRPRRHHRPHPADPDHAQGLALQLHALVPITGPLPRLQRQVGLRDVPGLRQQQRDRVLRGAHDVRLRRVHHEHAAPRAGLDVDVVEPDAGPRHHLQVVRGVDDRRVHPGLRPHDQRVVGRDGPGQPLLRQLRPNLDLEVLAQEVESSFGQRLGDQDAHR